MCDRTMPKSSIPASQIGFNKFLVLPFLQEMAKVLPALQVGVDCAIENMAFWTREQQKGHDHF